MATVNKEKVAPEGEVKTHSIRITLTSQNVKALEKGMYKKQAECRNIFLSLEKKRNFPIMAQHLVVLFYPNIYPLFL